MLDGVMGISFEGAVSAIPRGGHARVPAGARGLSLGHMQLRAH